MEDFIFFNNKKNCKAAGILKQISTSWNSFKRSFWDKSVKKCCVTVHTLIPAARKVGSESTVYIVHARPKSWKFFTQLGHLSKVLKLYTYFSQTPIFQKFVIFTPLTFVRSKNQKIEMLSSICIFFKMLFDDVIQKEQSATLLPIWHRGRGD